MSALVQVGSGSEQFYVRGGDVESLTWDRGHSYTTLIITMRTGTVHRVKDWNGSAYDAERAILTACDDRNKADGLA